MTETMRRAALCLTVAAVLASPAAAQELTVGVRAGPESMDPHFSALGNHASAMKHVFDTLVWSDEGSQPRPWLAESWKAVTPTTWEFKLRRGVKFHDGSEMTAEDVKHSVERVPEATGPTSTLIYVKWIKETKIVDPHTIHFVTEGPYATLPLDLMRLFVVSKKSAPPGTKGDAFRSGGAAIGTGPFKYVSWAPKNDLVVERFPGYWGGAAPWAKVTFKEISNDSARVAALLSGSVDFIDNVPAQDVPGLGKDSRVTLFKGRSVYVFTMQVDQREPTPLVTDNDGKPLPKNPFRDPRVREAFSLAVDRPALAERVLEGMAEPANQIVTADMFGYSKKIPPLGTDIERAKRLLAEAGYPSGFKTALHCTSDRLPGDGKVCATLGQMLARIGIGVQVNAVTRTVYFPAIGRKDYSFMMNGWGSLTGESSYILSTIAHTEDASLKMGAVNRVGYSNPRVDTLIRGASSELDDAKRRAMLEEAMELFVADRVYMPLVHLYTAWAGKAGRYAFSPRADEDTLAYFIRPAK